MEYKVIIDGVAELSDEITDITFTAKIPPESNARSTDLKAQLVIKGKISFMDGRTFMKDNMQKIAEWSLVKPSLADSYKSVTLEYMHAGAPRKYELPSAFVISYTETFGKTDGTFELILKQKEDMIGEVAIS